MNYKTQAFFVMKIISRLVAGCAFLLLMLGGAGVYDVLHPPRIVPPGYTLAERKIKYQKMDLMTQDGIRLTAWYTPPKNGIVILLAHGYGDNRPEWVYAMLAQEDYGILAWDARAHGESDGEISTLGYSEVLDVKAALDFALAQPNVNHIGAWGGSMGAATMIRAAAEFPQIEALVADSSFSSVDAEVDFLAPYPLVNPLAKILLSLGLGVNLEDSSPAALIHRISPRPVYIIQGTGDTMASPDSALKLYNAASEPRYVWIEENVIHLGMYLNNPRKYQRRVVGFFNEYLPAP